MPHTPTPWGVSREHPSFILAADKETGCIAATFQYGPDGETEWANAAFIVRSVNAHEALVDALEKAELFFKAIRFDSDRCPEAFEAKRAVGRALSLAKGEAEK